MNRQGFIAEEPRYICQYNLIKLSSDGSETDLGWQDAKIVVDEETGSYTNKAVFILGTTGRIKISVCIYDRETCQRGPVHTHKHTIRSQSWS